jgi:NADPH:quinone reductase-like Zn-dependent oxidoreductase
MTNLPKTMAAVHLMGHGGLDKLVYKEDVAVPVAGPGEVLIQVTGAGVNNTDINTRIGWYSKSVKGDTESGAAAGIDDVAEDDASWSGAALKFPLIQGADACGLIVAVGEGVDATRIGERVIVRTMMEDKTAGKPYYCWTRGSECNGGFAQFMTAPDDESFAVNCDWSDAELASLPCAYSTSEGMLHRANVGAERVLITGASGGVGSATIQLAKRRGAHVIAVSSSAKFDEVRAAGADEVIDRNADFVKELGADSIDVVIDLVAGPKWSELLDVLRRGGRYAVAGAIAGPLVELDVRTLYLKDLTFFGCTFQDRIVFENLVSYVEHGEIKPLVSKTYPLSEIHQAQEDFIAKKFTGKLVLLPPAVC